jgi:hypothetical protein
MAYPCKISGQPWNNKTREMTMPPIVKAVLAESADLLIRTVKVTVVVVILTLALILIGWFFSSSLPHQALMMINGR